MTFEPQQIAGIALILGSIGAVGYGPVKAMLTKPKGGKSQIKTLSDFKMLGAKRDASYAESLAKIEQMEAELEAIRKVVGFSQGDDEVES